MAKNNVQNVKFLRNGVVFTPSNDKTARQVALDAMEQQKANLADGTAILGRYQETNGDVKTLVGFAYISDNAKTLTVFDVDGASADVDKKILSAIQALNAEETSADGKNVQVKVTETDGKITAVNITTDNTVNSGDVNTAITNAINELDGSVVAESGFYVKSVTEVDGKISGTTAALPTVNAIGEAGKPITAVSENLGAVSAATGAINAEFVNIADSGKKFTASTVEAVLAEIDTEYKAADAAIVGNASATANTLAKLEDIVNNLSTNAKEYSIKQITDGLSTNVKEAWGLFDAYNHQSGATINIYKDSAYKEIYLGTSDDTIDATDGTITKKEGEKQSLNYAYMKADGTYDLVKVDVSAFLSENEFKSGVTVTNHIVHGVVDSTSEKDSQETQVDFLTVGENGFKVSGIKDEINRKINALDASVTGGTTEGTNHVQVVVDEVDGKLTAVTVNEANIADANKLVDLSGKTVTEVASSNDSIAATLSAATDGTKHLDIITDASKIKMSGFTKADALTKITESSSVTQALLEVDKVITEKAEVISTALNDLEATKAEKTALDAEIKARKDVDGQSGQTYAANTSANYISGATSLNDADIKLDAALKAVDDAMLTGVAAGNGITVSDKASKSQTISVKVKNDGGIVNDETGLHLGTIDCGTY